MVEQLSEALGDNSDAFIGICQEIEDDSQIEGVQLIVNYVYDNGILVIKTINFIGGDRLN